MVWWCMYSTLVDCSLSNFVYRTLLTRSAAAPFRSAVESEPMPRIAAKAALAELTPEFRIVRPTSCIWK